MIPWLLKFINFNESAWLDTLLILFHFKIRVDEIRLYTKNIYLELLNNRNTFHAVLLEIIIENKMSETKLNNFIHVGQKETIDTNKHKNTPPKT